MSRSASVSGIRGVALPAIAATIGMAATGAIGLSMFPAHPGRSLLVLLPGTASSCAAMFLAAHRARVLLGLSPAAPAPTIEKGYVGHRIGATLRVLGLSLIALSTAMATFLIISRSFEEGRIIVVVCGLVAGGTLIAVARIPRSRASSK